MNGKIKTKFAALFAVALMITVCVVPMVGGSEDVEAATPTTIDISGTVQNAAGQGWGGLEVTITSSASSAASITVKTETNGSFNAKDVKVGNITADVVVTPNLSDGTKNPAYGTSFPTITLTGVTVDQNIVIKAGTVAITGYLALKGTTNQGVFVKDLNITGGVGTVKTGKDGKFTFYGIPGLKYDLSSSLVGVNFKGSITPTVNGLNSVVLVAEDYMMKSELSAPFGSLKTTTTGTGTAAVVVASASVYTEIIDDVEKYYAYGKLTYATGTTLQVDAYWEYTDANNSNSKYGFQDSETKTLASANQTSGNYATSLSAKGTVITGYVTVGDVKVTPAITLISTATSTTEPSITAFVKDDKYFVGTAYLGVNSTLKTINAWKLTPTVSGATGYIFNEPTAANVPIKAQNAAKVTIDAGKSGQAFAVACGSGSTAIYSNQYTGTNYVTGVDGKIIAYVPLGSTNLVVTAPADIYMPASRTISAIYSDVTLDFDYLNEVEYKGQIILNGIPVGEEVIPNFGNVFVGVTGVAWADVDDGEEPYYTFKSKELPENISIKVSDAYPGTGNTGYEFVEDDSENVAKVASPGVMTDIVIDTVEQTQKVVDAKGFGIKGVNVDFKMFDGNDYSKAETIIDLGSAITDAQGVAEAKFTVPLAGYGIVVIVSSNSEYGEYTFANAGLSAYGSASIYAAESTYYGYYTSNGASLDGFGMSYVATSDEEIVDFGVAKIVDNMYYIVAPATTSGASATTVELKMTLDKGFTFSKTDKSVEKTLDAAGRADIVVYALAEDKSVDVEVLENEYDDFIEVYMPKDPVKGDVVVLSAEKTCYRLQNEMYGYKYSDAAVECTFAGWYVNGKLLTEDCDASITLKENVVISAQYEEAIKVIGSQDVPEAGLDTNVLILGIVVVVIALIAVVYSVISKRD